MGHLSVVKLFCEKGGNVNLPLKDRTTPLFVAAQNGHDMVVECLIRNGANVDIRRDVSISDDIGMTSKHKYMIYEDRSTVLYGDLVIFYCFIFRHIHCPHGLILTILSRS